MNMVKGVLLKFIFQLTINYCLLVWMLHSHSINNKINGLHERVLRIAYNDFKGCVRYIFASLFCMPKRQHL